MYSTSKILNGTIKLEGDKSLSHRLLMIASLIRGDSIVKNISKSKDVCSTIKCLQKCNINIENQDEKTTIYQSNFIEPNTKNSLTGEYPLARFLYIYVNKAPGKNLDPLTQEFLKMVLSKPGQQVVVKDGYFPIANAIAQQDLISLGISMTN